METVATFTMVIGFLLQNLAEWRGGGPVPRRKTAFGISLQPETDASRALALVLVSFLVVVLCAMALASGTAWILVGVAASLAANAIFQLGSSLRAKRALPGTIAGLIFMLPPSLWVLAVAEDRFEWLPVLLGPVASVPVLVVVWWFSDAIVSHTSDR